MTRININRMAIFFLNMKQAPHCEYCNCSVEESLVKCPVTGYYFCNGKGDTKQSHILYHLRQINSNLIELPESNSYANSIVCYVCQSKNIYSLGFVTDDKNENLFVVCRGECLYHKSLSKECINPETFTPIISNGEIIHEIVPIPQDNQYTKVSISHVKSVSEAIKSKIPGFRSEPSPNIQKAKFVYHDENQFSKVIGNFLDLEKEEMNKYHDPFPVNQFRMIENNICSFRSSQAAYRALNIGTTVRFSCEGMEKDATIIKCVMEFEMRARFSEPPLFSENSRNICVTLIPSSIAYSRQKEALRRFEQENSMDPFIKKVILGKVSNFKEENFIPNSKAQFYQPDPSIFEAPNQSQRNAIEIALKNRFTLIQGPPGTGKTTVVASLAYSFVKSGIRPVLVCTQSNIATDFALKRISQTGVNVVRVISNSIDDTNELTEKYSTKSIAKKRLESLEDPYNSQALIKMERAIVQEADVVCTTCVSAGGSRLATSFPVVIFDESGQIMDADLLIPLVHSVRQAVLVGDHKQLGPLFISNQASSGGYNIPLMQRLVTLQVMPNILLEQYRMHPTIAEFPSKTFYDSFLKNGVTEQQRKRHLPTLQWPNQNDPYIVWNMPQAREEVYENGVSYFNMHEVGACCVIVESLYTSGVAASDIGIITPYVGQQLTLRAHLPLKTSKTIPKAYLEDLEIESVDAFQGREKKYIILSNVRANDQFEIGFLKDARRLCVALTRAQFGLFVLIHAPTFSKNPLWCKLIDHAISKDFFKEGSLNSFKKSSYIPQITPKANSEMEDVLE